MIETRDFVLHRPQYAVPSRPDLPEAIREIADVGSGQKAKEAWTTAWRFAALLDVMDIFLKAHAVGVGIEEATWKAIKALFPQLESILPVLDEMSGLDRHYADGRPQRQEHVRKAAFFKLLDAMFNLVRDHEAAINAVTLELGPLLGQLLPLMQCREEIVPQKPDFGKPRIVLRDSLPTPLQDVRNALAKFLKHCEIVPIHYLRLKAESPILQCSASATADTSADFEDISHSDGAQAAISSPTRRFSLNAESGRVVLDGETIPSMDSDPLPKRAVIFLEALVQANGTAVSSKDLETHDGLETPQKVRLVKKNLPIKIKKIIDGETGKGNKIQKEYLS
jgi:hypothetical protein